MPAHPASPHAPGAGALKFPTLFVISLSDGGCVFQRFVTPYGQLNPSKAVIWFTFVVDLTDSSDRFREDVVIFCRMLTLPITPVAAPKLLSTLPILSLIAEHT